MKTDARPEWKHRMRCADFLCVNALPITKISVKKNQLEFHNSLYTFIAPRYWEDLFFMTPQTHLGRLLALTESGGEAEKDSQRIAEWERRANNLPTVIVQGVEP